MRESAIQFVAEHLIHAQIRPASLNGVQTWVHFERLVWTLSLDNEVAQYYWYATQAEYTTFVELITLVSPVVVRRSLHVQRCL